MGTDGSDNLTNQHSGRLIAQAMKDKMDCKNGTIDAMGFEITCLKAK